MICILAFVTTDSIHNMIRFSKNVLMCKPFSVLTFTHTDAFYLGCQDLLMTALLQASVENL